ncbi:polyketide synthase dehydratase domain-containing protein [Cellulosilyticum ruminicola]|uniref:polyketide synthase dehydratase domain-containing protein n=1 Tax=Cellulosilyticum ruminicola TaxID=425254 RepID=UPI00241EE47E|nr:polyketide synthase dehydratase domain-containing protein [Cellulosilyticum ruminicola]
MQQYVKEHMLDMDLSNVLYTLQVGREAMEERLAILISTSQELLDKLNEYLSQGTNNKDIFESKIAKKVIRLKESMDNCIPERNTVINNEILQQLVDAWLKGEKVAWERIYEGCNIRKVSLPTYPFEKEKHWFTKKTNKVENKKNTFRLHALVHENISDFEEQHFRSVFEANELIFEEHQINNQKLLPGVAVLEMVRAAAQLSGNKAVKSIMNVIWCYPIQLRGEKTIVDIHLYPEDNETVHFEITIPDENEDIICAEGTVSYKALKKQEEANEFLKYTKRCNQSIEPKVLYESMSKNGIVYGKMFKTLEKVHYNEKEVIAYIKSSTKQDEYMLAPGLLDGALQTVSLLIRDTKSAYVPFTAGKIEIYKELRENAYVHTQYIRENKGIKYFDVTIVDEQGNLIANITDFSVKELAKARENKLMYFEPYWELEENKQNDKVETVIIFDDLNMLKQSLMESKCVQEIIHIKSGTQYEALENNIYTIRPFMHRRLYSII